MNETAATQTSEVAEAVRKMMTQWITLQGMQLIIGLFTVFAGVNRLPNTYDPFTVKFLLWLLLAFFVAQLAWFGMRGLRERKRVLRNSIRRTSLVGAVRYE